MKALGILGGGQLSKLLSLKAQTLGLKAFVLSESQKDPAALGNPFWIHGSPERIKDLQAFLNPVDLLTFESEFFSANSIQKAIQRAKGKRVPTAPSLKALSLLQDRWTQKNLLSKYEFPTADYCKLDLKSGAKAKLIEVWKKLGPFVLKSRTGGYDGYGSFLIKRKAQIESFCRSSFEFSDLPPSKNRGSQDKKQRALGLTGIKWPSQLFIAEKFIPFQRELAILAARNKRGQIVFFPLVESFQKDSRCLWVKGPEKHKRLHVLKKQIRFFLDSLFYEGLIAFELFDMGERLLVNELAPRVHNSGHYSLEALDQDQFTVHLKAIQNKALKSPKVLKKGFAMYNLLGGAILNPYLERPKPLLCIYSRT